MKLRNKKTGEIIDLDEWSFDTYNDMFYLARGDAEGDNIEYFKSFADFMSKYEDYTPAEPPIKDEKIRKAVRAWAEAGGIEKVLSYGDYFWIGFRSTNAESYWKFECNYTDASEFQEHEEYTIAELCGEEG